MRFSLRASLFAVLMLIVSAVPAQAMQNEWPANWTTYAALRPILGSSGLAVCDIVSDSGPIGHVVVFDCSVDDTARDGVGVHVQLGAPGGSSDRTHWDGRSPDYLDHGQMRLSKDFDTFRVKVCSNRAPHRCGQPQSWAMDW